MSDTGVNTSIMDQLYASEINARIEWFWDGGFDVMLGDAEWNGFIYETNVRTWNEVEQWLEEATIKHYPQSKFALSRAAAKPDGDTL